MTTVADITHALADRFDAAGLYYGHGTLDALDEAAWLTSWALGIDPGELNDHASEAMPTEAQAKLNAMAARRIEERKPVAYLIKEAWFAGLRFYIDERALIPRSLIGEYICEDFSPWVDAAKLNDVLDLCTGGGSIAIAIAKHLPHTHVDAADLSPEALAVARINVDLHEVHDRVTLIESDLFGGIKDKQYDLIVSNPPYVPDASMAELPAEYKHEPTLALRADSEGLALVDTILREAGRHLRPGGALIMEVGESREAVSVRYAHLPLTWLAHESGEDSVLFISKENLDSAYAP